MRIDGKVVLITGASEGIGAACARSSPPPEPGSPSPPAMKTACAAPPVPMPSSPPATSPTDEDRRRVVERTLERFGAIDILINNAGIGIYQPSWEMPMDEARYLMELNFFAPLAMTQLVVPHMRARRSGMIVNVGSIGGKVVLPWMTLYSVTKSALGALTEGLRMELMRRWHPHHAGLPRLCEDRIPEERPRRPGPRERPEGAPLRHHSRSAAPKPFAAVWSATPAPWSRPAPAGSSSLAMRLFPSVVESRMAAINGTA